MKAPKHHTEFIPKVPKLHTVATNEDPQTSTIDKPKNHADMEAPRNPIEMEYEIYEI